MFRSNSANPSPVSNASSLTRSLTSSQSPCSDESVMQDSAGSTFQSCIVETPIPTTIPKNTTSTESSLYYPLPDGQKIFFKGDRHTQRVLESMVRRACASLSPGDRGSLSTSSTSSPVSFFGSCSTQSLSVRKDNDASPIPEDLALPGLSDLENEMNYDELIMELEFADRLSDLDDYQDYLSGAKTHIATRFNKAEKWETVRAIWKKITDPIHMPQHQGRLLEKKHEIVCALFDVRSMYFWDINTLLIRAKKIEELDEYKRFVTADDPSQYIKKILAYSPEKRKKRLQHLFEKILNCHNIQRTSEEPRRYSVPKLEVEMFVRKYQILHFALNVHLPQNTMIDIITPNGEFVLEEKSLLSLIKEYPMDFPSTRPAFAQQRPQPALKKP